MYKGKIIDCRLRPPTKEFKDQFQALDRALISRVVNTKIYGSLPEWIGQDTEDFVEEMRDLDFIGAVVGRLNYPGLPPVYNDHIKSLMDKYPGMFIGIGSVDDTNPKSANDEIARLAKSGFKGICLGAGRPGQPDPGNKLLFPIYEQIASLDLVNYVVTSPYYTSTPNSWEPVAANFPKLRILFAHGCYPYIHELIGLVWRRPNVWYCPDCYSFSPGAQLYVEACNYSTDTPRYPAYPYMQQLQDRYCFGTAIPYSSPLKVRLQEWKNLGWREEILDKLLYKNAAELFRIK